MLEAFAAEFIGMPEYTVNIIRTEDAGNGIVRIFHWVKKGGLLEPQFTALVAAADLLTITRDVQRTATEVLIDLSRDTRSYCGAAN
ncbi:hypothetical protein IC762_12150 [Bradyrhizobium genosp. L]|uniref:hypothetical protein n=1 Tax=Bradyrhizobium genosp. L TaxID=83637 RepID=UPI0018A24F89|nr:hypothetical protein [Bradyrhizobium genosp. L]QPF86996.1 hypothetical protein IC762_12150 [Bradyrhizobium genosp. L]